ncbi:MAG: hypothetical protein VSS52_002345 [Thiotrichaceae bacterium]|nr:hypothetical protein [Thiotrichaceae bacterium]
MMKKNQKMKITDPYLKERIQMAGEQSSGMGWFIWLFFIALIGGSGYYFYPQIKPHVQPLVTQVQQQVQEQISAFTAESKPAATIEPVNTANTTVEKAETSIETNQTESQAINDEVKVVTSEKTPEPEKNPALDVSETMAAKPSDSAQTTNTSEQAAKSTPTISKPETTELAATETKPETNAPITESTPTSLSKVAVTTALPHEMPTDVKTIAKTEAKTEAKTDTKPVAELTPQQQAEVKKLMSKAEVQLRRLRLTKPENDNAYSTYQDLKKLDEQKANEVLTSIVTWYQKDAQKNLKEGWIAYPADRNAMVIYERLQKLAPKHEGTAKLLEDILLALKERVDIHLDRNNILKPKNDNAYINARLMHNAAAQHEITQASLANVEQRMLKIADKQIAQKKFTTPEDDSAYQTYQIMLKMNPESTKAKQAIENLATRYYNLALKRKGQGRKTSALSLVERGLAIDAEHKKLQNLKQQLEK